MEQQQLQLEEAIEFAAQMVRKGADYDEIEKEMNRRGMKTTRGIKWTAGHINTRVVQKYPELRQRTRKEPTLLSSRGYSKTRSTPVAGEVDRLQLIGKIIKISNFTPEEKQLLTQLVVK